MEKNKLFVSLVAVVLALAVMNGARASTQVDTTWNGAGQYHLSFTGDDDATNTFNTGGDLISGEYHGINSENNPYHYGVNDVDAKVKASVTNGFVEYTFDRTDSYTPMYGNAGQHSYSYVGTDGTGSLAWHSHSNFASLKECNYGWQSNDQLQANGNHYLEHDFVVAPNVGAGIVLQGSGTSSISDMSDESWKSSFKFGKGCGCYTNAEVNSVGSGVFDLTAQAPNSIDTDFGVHTDGVLNVHSEFNNGFVFDDYALSGN